MKPPLPLLLLAGAPGTGKTTVASRLPGALVVSMDDFYLAADDPRLPRTGSEPDWEHKGSVDLSFMCRVLERLLLGEPATIPTYDMRRSRAGAARLVDPGGARAVVAEGVHVFDLRLAEAGRVTRVLLTAPFAFVVARRLRRDLREGRYPPAAAPAQTMRLMRVYKNYEAEEGRRADYVVRHGSDPAATAERIRALVGYW